MDLTQNDGEPLDAADNELFCALTAANESGNPLNGQGRQAQDEKPRPSTKKPQQSKRPQTKRKKVNRISADEKRRSMRYGPEFARLQGKRRSMGRNRKRKATSSDTTINANYGDTGQQGKKKRASKRAKTSRHEVDFDGLFSADVVANAHANATLPDVPTMTGKDKEKALTQLVASIPSSDRAEAKSDKRLVLESSKKFNAKARSDGKGGWKIKGLLSSLFHYQVWILSLLYTPSPKLTIQKNSLLEQDIW